MSILIRPIEKQDNPKLTQLIKGVFIEFKVDGPGCVFSDPTTDHLYELFQTQKSAYWVAIENETIVGGCGIFPTDGLPDGYAELVKFYLSTQTRGKGIGKELMQTAISWASDSGYTQLYLESFAAFGKAVGMYEKAEFKPIKHALGNSGHYACTIWMVKDLV